MNAQPFVYARLKTTELPNIVYDAVIFIPNTDRFVTQKSVYNPNIVYGEKLSYKWGTATEKKDYRFKASTETFKTEKEALVYGQKIIAGLNLPTVEAEEKKVTPKNILFVEV